MSNTNENEKVKVPVISFKGNKAIRGKVGYIEGDTYHTERKKIHYFRIFQGYGMSIDVYNSLVSNGIIFVNLHQNNIIFESKLKQWKHTSRWDNEILKTNKIDPQYILKEAAMKVYEMKGGANMETQDLDKIGPVQSSTVDLIKYDKTVTTIEKAETTQLPSQFTAVIPGTQQHYMQWVLKVSSVVLESIREGEDKIEFRASEVFNLIQDDKGNLTGFPTGEGAKLMKFMKDLKIPSPEKLQSLKQVIEAIKGKTTVIKSETKERDGRTNTYLRFRY
jgi:hypothetical protein